MKKKFPNFRSYTWYDRGSDERQFCSPGIDLPMVTLMRTKYGEYKEYHTSLDKIGTVVTSDRLLGGYKLVKNIIDELESKKYPIDIISKPLALNKCEPFMTKRKLYPTTSKANNSNYLKIIWIYSLTLMANIVCYIFRNTARFLLNKPFQ